MITFIGPDIILSDLTEGPTLFAQSVNNLSKFHAVFSSSTFIRLDKDAF